MQGAKLVIFGRNGKIFMLKNARKALISCIFRINFARIPTPKAIFTAPETVASVDCEVRRIGAHDGATGCTPARLSASLSLHFVIFHGM